MSAHASSMITTSRQLIAFLATSQAAGLPSSSCAVVKTGSTYTNRCCPTQQQKPKRKAPFSLDTKVAARLCTGCHREEAEHVHAVLGVQICGVCNKGYNDALELERGAGAKRKVEHINRCLWCSRVDDVNLFLCDGCQYAFCLECVSSNFGKAEALRLRRDRASWSCYSCAPTPAFQRLQEETRSSRERMFNLEEVYRRLRAPEDYLQRSQEELLRVVGLLTPSELRLASIFTDAACTSVYKSANISDYLQAQSLLMLRCLSRNLRALFLLLDLTPGLFKTPYGGEHACRLHPHQKVSLACMRHMEMRNAAFGAVRGGVLADAPGLGKTVTVLALIASTAGTLPRVPATRASAEGLASAWAESAPSLQAMVRPLFNSLRRIMGADPDLVQLFDGSFSLQSPAAVLLQFPTVQSFEKSVVRLLRTRLSGGPLDHALERVRIDMVGVREGLDKRSRSYLTSKGGRRMRLEQELRGSSATLIIVPLTLLEHWFEQISRHLHMGYFCRDEARAGMRGAVYIDGMGDIVDVAAPLRRTVISSDIGVSVEQLSQYVIVVTTFERCHKEHGMAARSSSAVLPSVDRASREASTLSKIRWLRVVVDEGHELGQHSSGTSQSGVVAFIHSLAAERRWVCSGTPTVGTNSGRALGQLQRLLLFLRHEEFGCDAEGEQRWTREVVEPFVRGNEGAATAHVRVVSVLRQLMIRHTKEDLRLHVPVRLSVVVPPLPDPTDSLDDETRWVDRAIAMYVCDALRQRRAEQRADRRLRRPKFIIFSKERHNLQGVAHYLYLRLGDAELCEHFGTYRSSELSRFRHSLRRFRVCPMCGFENSITSGDYCDRRLILVEYRRDLKQAEDESWDGTAAGMFTGRCLCSHEGCAEWHPSCRPNALFSYSSQNNALEVIAEEHIMGHRPGRQYLPGEQVFVLPQSAADSADEAVLWRVRGRCGGVARVVQWLPCGGRGTTRSFHSDRLLASAPWQTVDEGASVMLLEEDGSTGLDLSFVTDIFLLERIKDPALESQVISRAHRMGATGPVTVTLVEVSDTAEFKEDMDQRARGAATAADSRS